VFVQRIRDLLVRINEAGTSILLVEQNAAMALAIADHGYVVETGKVVLDKRAAALREDDDVREFYLGLREDGASFKRVKHYRRRKRWAA
jgi:branched-chain amino acid transport system ATP-binding protein